MNVKDPIHFYSPGYNQNPIHDLLFVYIPKNFILESYGCISFSDHHLVLGLKSTYRFDDDVLPFHNHLQKLV
ncbi:unnamed protein product [Heterobilharzia americana]|nr:unnamed protein product [Heterobilharzia americana]